MSKEEKSEEENPFYETHEELLRRRLMGITVQLSRLCDLLERLLVIVES